MADRGERDCIMCCRWSLITLVAVAAMNVGCQQLDRRSGCGVQPGCSCTATEAGCHCGSGQPACGSACATAPATVPATPPVSGAEIDSRYEEVPQKPPMAAPPARRTAPPPPPTDDARAPRPLIFQ
jgi:hypothetical protein